MNDAGTDAAALSDKLIDVEGGREKAFAFIDGIDGLRGMTNINDALLTALAETPDSEPSTNHRFPNRWTTNCWCKESGTNSGKRLESEQESIPHFRVWRRLRCK